MPIKFMNMFSNKKYKGPGVFQKMPVSRIKIMLLWLLYSVACSVIFTIVTILCFQFKYSVPNSNQNPIDNIGAILEFMPLGWSMFIFYPPGWLSIIGLGFALYTRSKRPLALSALGSSLFGILWPLAFWAMMGV